MRSIGSDERITTSDAGAIEMVQEGMRVVGPDGREVDGPGILDSDRYVPAGLIVGVSDGVVRLAASGEEDVIPEMR